MVLDNICRLDHLEGPAIVRYASIAAEPDVLGIQLEEISFVLLILYHWKLFFDIQGILK